LNVHSYASAGGIVGYNYNGIITENCTASGNVSSNYYAGGFAGVNNGTIEYCTASGNVSSSFYAGGFIGRNSGTTTNNRNNTGVSPAIGRDDRKNPASPSDDI
jgi:hypothetical protein